MFIRSLLLFALIPWVAGTIPAYQWDGRTKSSSGRDFNLRENFEVRRLQQDLIFSPTETALRYSRSVFTQQGSEHRVAVEVKRTDAAFYVLFTNEEELSFPLYSRGSWIVKRDGRTGAFLQVKIFYQSEPGSYVRIFPLRDRTLMDVYLFDRPLHLGVPLGKAFSDILLSSFQDIIDLSQGTVDWQTLVPPIDTDLYSSVRSMAGKIRSALHTLPDAEDGAMDKDGKLVAIETLSAQERLPGFNCSGFAKWVADGIYYERTGGYLDISDLKKKHLDARGSNLSRRYETERDPFFGLDWTRNIAAALSGGEQNDVASLPYWKYRKDIGFAVKDLRTILYYLSLKDPGVFYLGSVNREFGSNPVLRQHIHVVVLFPNFDEKGNFHVAVMERNVESSLESLEKRYATDFIHLVGIQADENFTAVVIE